MYLTQLDSLTYRNRMETPLTMHFPKSAAENFTCIRLNDEQAAAETCYGTHIAG